MYEELIERLREYPDREETAGGYVEVDWQDLLDAADAIESLTAQLSALQAENGSKDREIERLKLHKRCASCGHDLAGDLAICRPCVNELDDDIKAALSRVEAERDAAYEAICNYCEYIPCRREECMWWRSAQGEE